jgi:glycosyltransferase involved in cell wall biosynthesis
VLFVGRLVKGKRPEDAIEAVARLPAELDAKLYMVGDGPLRPELVAKADENVTFLGQVPYNQMPAVYRGGDVLMLPSRAEGLPRTVLEAFASGVPVVSSHLEQIASVVNVGGETVEIGDIGGYANAITRVLENADKLGEQGRQMVLDEFRWQDTVKETTEVMNSLR